MVIDSSWQSGGNHLRLFRQVFGSLVMLKFCLKEKEAFQSLPGICSCCCLQWPDHSNGLWFPVGWKLARKTWGNQSIWNSRSSVVIHKVRFSRGCGADGACWLLMAWERTSGMLSSPLGSVCQRGCWESGKHLGVGCWNDLADLGSQVSIIIS